MAGKAALISLLCIAVNLLGDTMAVGLKLPLWLDSFGTMLAGYLFGPIAGGAVGFVSHILICIKDSSNTYVYALANMMIGIMVAEEKKRGHLRDLFGYCNVALLLSLISIAVSIPNTIVLRGGMMVNTWGNDVVTALRAISMPIGAAVFLGEFYVDFVDKLLMMYMLYFSMLLYDRIVHHIQPHFDKMDVLNLLVLPFVVIESIIRRLFKGNFVDSVYFKNYILLVFVLMVSWFSWFVATAMQRRTIKRQSNEMAMLRQKNSLVKGTVLTIAHMVDAKDVYTAKHSSRVTKYSLMIGERLGFSQEELQNLERAALLHDIGKVGIPDRILNKKGKLTKEEFQVMQTHPVLGSEILKDFDFAPEIREGAMAHHERYDGTGYPNGLAGEDIPLFGRIIGIADAYDAMSSNRIYRPKCTTAYIVNEFRQGRGTQFDPKLCDIFLDLMEENEGFEAEWEEEYGAKMTLDKAYELFGGRYSVITQRLKSDEVIRVFLHDFLESEEFGALKRALVQGDDRKAFRAVHTLKGISLNMDMRNLARMCIALTENLRYTPINAQTSLLFAQVEKEYETVCGIIRELEQAMDDETLPRAE